MQADIRTLESIDIDGVYAVTAVTAQDSTSVAGVMPVSKDLLGLQIDLAIGEQSPAATKVGMLATAENVAVVSDRMKAGKLPNAIVDPVLAASSGKPLIEEAGIEAYRELLIPHTYILTPNIPEAELLAGTIISDVDSMVDAAMGLHDMGAQVVIIKGGHANWETPEKYISPDTSPDAPMMLDIIVGLNDDVGALVSPRLQVGEIRGTGCTFSSAIAGYIVHGYSAEEAITAAKRYVTQYIAKYGSSLSSMDTLNCEL